MHMHTCRPPYVFVDRSRTGNLRFSGFMVDMMPFLLRAAGLGNVPVEYYEMASNAGGSLVNGSWSGEVASLPMPASAADPVDLEKHIPCSLQVVLENLSTERQTSLREHAHNPCLACWCSFPADRDADADALM